MYNWAMTNGCGRLLTVWLLLCATDYNEVSTGLALTCPASYTAIGSYCLVAFTTSGMTNAQAVATCASMSGGSLPTFANAAEAELFRSVVYSMSTEIPYVGYYNYQSHSASSPGVWYDVSQVSCPFTSWETGEPNNNGGAENCVRLVMSSTSYMMEDVSCSLTPKILYCMTRPTALTACGVPAPTTLAPPPPTKPVISNGISCPTSDYYSLGYYCVVLLNVTAVNNSMAKSNCESRNDTLPTFTNATELDIFRLYVTAVTTSAAIWLGYWNYNVHSIYSPGTWLDATGTSCPYIRWAPGEPNDDTNNPLHSESCAEVMLYGNTFDCNDGPCSNTRNVLICMWRPNPIANCPGVTTTPKTTTSTAAVTVTSTVGSTADATAATTVAPTATNYTMQITTTLVPTAVTTAGLTTTPIPPSHTTVSETPTIVNVAVVPDLIDILPVVIAIIAGLIIITCLFCATAAVIYKRRLNEKKKVRSTQTDSK